MWRRSSSVLGECRSYRRRRRALSSTFLLPRPLHHHPALPSFSRATPPNPDPFLADILKRYGPFFLSTRTSITTGECPEPGLLPGKRQVGLPLPLPAYSHSSTLLMRGILDQSRRFRLHPDGLVSRAQDLGEMGLGDETLIRIMEELPEVPLSMLDVAEKIEFLADFGFRREEIDRILRSFPGLLAFGNSGRLKPLFKELEDVGSCKQEVKRMILGNPRLLLGMEAGEASWFSGMIDSLKCRKSIKERLLEKGRLRAAIETKVRVDCLCRHGLIRREAMKVVWVEPRTVLYDLEDMEKKIEFLLHDMGFGIGCLVDVPEYLGVNMEKQIVPRFRVVERLRWKGALGFEVGLWQLIKPSRKKFYNMFVKPYPECEAIFAGPTPARRQHPPGLWRLLRPSKRPETEEELANVRAFMDSLV